MQIDGSPHNWLEGRGRPMVLSGAIDDATGKIIYARFRPTEDQAGYLVMLRAIADEHGLPLALYHDRHTILRSPKELTITDELAGRRPMSQVQAILDELGIRSIPAMSPQAKGRVERLWRTLQDRLTKEMRLADINTLEEANRFLPDFIRRFNARFAVEAREAEPAWRARPAGFDADYYFAVREERLVRRDHTLAWQGQCLQIVLEKADPSLAGKRVRVHTTPEGVIHLYTGERRLRYRVLDDKGAPAQPLATSRPVKKGTGMVDPEAKAAARRRRLGWLFTSGP